MMTTLNSYTHTPEEVAEGILSGKYTLTSMWVLVNQIADVARERDEARAEVERLELRRMCREGYP